MTGPEPVTSQKMEVIIASFAEEYKPLLAMIPTEVLPQSTSHGQHSYTALLAQNQVCLFGFKPVLSIDADS